jgi:anti-anti-sigma factor
MAPALEYQLQGNELHVSGELAEVFDFNFELAVSDLLHSDAEEIVIDLRGVRRIASQYLGLLATLAQQSAAKQKKLRVRATGDVAQMIHMAGFERLMELEIV